jgi:hypothetical protein
VVSYFSVTDVTAGYGNGFSAGLIGLFSRDRRRDHLAVTPVTVTARLDVLDQ